MNTNTQPRMMIAPIALFPLPMIGFHLQLLLVAGFYVAAYMVRAFMESDKREVF